MKSKASTKHARVRAVLSRDILGGRWQPGERLPSDAELVESFGVSRITVSRAMRDLQSAGLVERRPGSGSYVAQSQSADGHSFGLLIPDLGDTEIFEPICHGMMSSPLARRHVLLWGNSATIDEAAAGQSARGSAAWQLCRQFIERKVSGVFFAPLELAPDKDDLNRRIARALDKARIPMVLLDRPLLPFPAPRQHDLVGIDNRIAGQVITRHLLELGCRRIQFVALGNSASTVDEREAGYREALYSGGLPCERAFVYRLDPDASGSVGRMMQAARPDGIVCANDRTAGRLMHTLLRLGYRVPQDVRIVGIDDAGYASLMPVPLTTLRQPTRQIGDAALALMLERIARPGLPARDTRLQCELVIRESCGSKTPAAS